MANRNERFVQTGFQASTGAIVSLSGTGAGLYAAAGSLVLSGISSLLYNPSKPRSITIDELEGLVKGSQEHATPMGMVGPSPIGNIYAVIVPEGYKPSKQIAGILSATSVIKSAEDFKSPLPAPQPVKEDMPLSWIGETPLVAEPKINPGLLNIIPSTAEVPSETAKPSGISLGQGIASNMQVSPISEAPLKEVRYDYSLIFAAAILLIVMVIA